MSTLVSRKVIENMVNGKSAHLIFCEQFGHLSSSR